jgi:DNA-binding CsgD family transcriptional regulator
MASEAAVATFLDELYDAAIFPERWPDVVEGYRRLLNPVVGNVSTHMNVVDLVTGVPSHNWIGGVDPELIRQGVEYYFQQDKWVDACFQSASRAVRQGEKSLILCSQEILEPGELQATEFYQDFLQQFQVVDMMCAASIIDQTKMFTLVANPIDSRPFETRDKQFLQQLLGHIDRAFRLSVKVGFADSSKAVAQLWEQSALPVMVVQQGSLSYANICAERVLSQSGIVARSGAGLLFADESVNVALRKLTRHDAQAAGDASRVRQAAVQVDDSKGESWMVQLVRLDPPRQDVTARLFSVDPGVFIMLTPLNSVATLRAGSIDSLAKFTAVEKELLHALVDGRTIQQIARQTGRSEATLRWHVRNLLSKSGLRSLTDLIRFASLLMPF